jgi:hypothetical protein
MGRGARHLHLAIRPALPVDLRGSEWLWRSAAPKYLNGGLGRRVPHVRPDCRIAVTIGGLVAMRRRLPDLINGAPGILRISAARSPFWRWRRDAALGLGRCGRTRCGQVDGAAFIDLPKRRGRHGVRLYGPRNMTERGSHVALHCAEGYAVMQALIAHGVIGDFRSPDLIRLCNPHPLLPGGV